MQRHEAQKEKHGGEIEKATKKGNFTFVYGNEKLNYVKSSNQMPEGRCLMEERKKISEKER